MADTPIATHHSQVTGHPWAIVRHVGCSLLRMSAAQTLLIVMTSLVSGMAVYLLIDELFPMLRDQRTGNRTVPSTGDTTLTPRSVNWLAAMALFGAFFICFVLA